MSKKSIKFEDSLLDKKLLSDPKAVAGLAADLASSLGAPQTKTPFQWGQVRASPYGSCLDSLQEHKDAEEWHGFRKQRLQPLQVPLEGYDHVYGQNVMDAIDKTPLGDSKTETSVTGDPALKNPHDFGSTKTPDDAPVGSLKDKWRLLPHFLKLRSLMRQHIDSFDYFVNVEMKQIVQSPSACEIRSEHDPNFYLRYTDCWVGDPSVEEDSYSTTQATPFQCRLRDCTYSGKIDDLASFIRKISVHVNLTTFFHSFSCTKLQFMSM